MLYFWIRSLVACGSVDDSPSVLTDTSHLSLGNFSQVSLAFIWTHKHVDLGALTVGGIILVIARSDVRTRRGGERRGLRSRHYLVWVVDDEREVGEGAEAFEAPFIGVV